MNTPTSTAPNPLQGASGSTFRAARRGAGLSIRALASRVEKSHSTISLWERGKRDIGESTYEHLTLALADFMAGRWSE